MINMEIDYTQGHLDTIKNHRTLLDLELFNNQKYDSDKKYLITVEPEKHNISRQMQRFYYGHLIKSIIQWNIETGIFCYEGTETTITDQDEIDYILREFFFSKKVTIKDKVVKIPKTLKMTKANMKECCDYFDTIMRFFATKGLDITGYDFR